MKKVYVEFGYGNQTFVSSEIEDGDTEWREAKIVWPKKFLGVYLRLWIFKTVYILASNEGFIIKQKSNNNFKILLGFEGRILYE